MNDCSVALDSARPVPASSSAASRFGGFVGVAVFALVLMCVLNVFRREPYYGDEGFYAMTAVNMVESPGVYLLRPSFYPAGDFRVEKDAFAHPPVSSYLYALVLWAFGGALASLDVLHVVAFALVLFFVWKALRLLDVPDGAGFAVVLLVVSPSVFGLFSQLEAEPLLVAFGVASLYCVLRAGRSARPGRWFVVSGLCFGMAFALKLWLAAPFALALLAAVVLSGRGSRFKVQGLAMLAAAALVPSAAHLLAVALFSADDLGFWLKNVYLGVWTKSGISGGKFGSGSAPSDWVHPWWYYGATFYRDHFFLVPIVLLGGVCWWLEGRLDGRLAAMVGAGVIGFVPLSLMSVKETLYVLPCTVFVYMLAGCCLAALARRVSGGGVFPRVARVGCAGALALLLAGVALAYGMGLKRSDITAGFVVGHSVVMVVWLGLCLFGFGRSGGWPGFESAVCVVCALFLVGAFGHRWAGRPPQDRVLVELVRPVVAGHGAREVAFVSSNFKPLQAMIFRRGCYWEELPEKVAPEAVLAMPQFARIRAFVIDAKDQQKGHFKQWTDWLEKNAVEQTRELDARLGRSSGLRVFVL